MNDHALSLDALRASYPFQRWADSGLPQYTPQARYGDGEGPASGWRDW